VTLSWHPASAGSSPALPAADLHPPADHRRPASCIRQLNRHEQKPNTKPREFFHRLACDGWSRMCSVARAWMSAGQARRLSAWGKHLNWVELNSSEGNHSLRCVSGSVIQTPPQFAHLSPLSSRQSECNRRQIIDRPAKRFRLKIIVVY